MRWSRRHPYAAWVGTVLLLAFLFLGVRDMGMAPAGALAVTITVACAIALIAGDLITIVAHRWRRWFPR